MINESSAERMFVDYADPDDPSTAGMEGISKLCEQLDLDPVEDITILVLLWKMGAAQEKPAQISKEEWIKGCEKLQVDSVAKFKDLLPSLDLGFLDQSEFKDFYKFCFQFNRQGTHRTLDCELVVMLLQLIFGTTSAASNRIPSDRLQSFSSFLEASKKEYSRITLDQWTSFLDFCYECEDLSEYDEANSAWPVLIDEYVEHIMLMEQQRKKK